MPIAPNPFVITATRGLDQRQQPTTDGANGFALEAENLGFGHAGAMVMRLGLTEQDLTDAGVTGSVDWVGKHVTQAGVEELWLASNNAGTANLARRVAGTWSTVSFSDTVTVANLRYMCGASLDGLFALCYDSNVNRMHVWDGTSLRRMGIAKPAAAPTVADTGAGAYGATQRVYRVQFLVINGTRTLAASELSDASTPFTPSGAGSAARVTKPTTPDGATHWRVYGLAGGTDTYDSYQLISGNIAVGTTTYDDSTAPASYDGENPAEIGTYMPPPSAKYVTQDGSRFLFAEPWESSGSAGQTDPRSGRVWFTPRSGASDIGDLERIPNTATQFNKYDCLDAGPITAISEPLEGRIYVLKQGSVAHLSPTGNLENPYAYRLLTGSAGCVDQRCLVNAENGEGVPCLYFAARSSVYQLLNGAIRDISEHFRRDIRLANFTAADSFLGWIPLEKSLFIQAKRLAGSKVGQYRTFLYDVASERVSGAQFGTYQAGWVLGVSILGVNTTLTATGFIRHGVTALDEDGIPRLVLAGQTAEDGTGEGAVYAYGAQIGTDGARPFTGRLRVRLPLGLAQRRMVSLGAPTVIYCNPIGSEDVDATLTLSYYTDDGRSASQSKVLDATEIDDPLGQKRTTFEALQIGDTFVADVRAQLTYDAAVMDVTVPPSVLAIIVPWTADGKLTA